MGTGGDDGRKNNGSPKDGGFEAELECRLETIESPYYRDPARRDLPLAEMVVFTVVGAVIVLLVHLWGY